MTMFFHRILMFSPRLLFRIDPAATNSFSTEQDKLQNNDTACRQMRQSCKLSYPGITEEAKSFFIILLHYCPIISRTTTIGYETGDFRFAT